VTSELDPPILDATSCKLNLMDNLGAILGLIEEVYFKAVCGYEESELEGMKLSNMLVSRERHTAVRVDVSSLCAAGSTRD
jgi:uncharacterized protein YrrD